MIPPPAERTVPQPTAATARAVVSPLEAALTMRLEATQAELQQAAQIIDLVQRLFLAENLAVGTKRLATEIATLFGGTVAVGWCDQLGECQLSATSQPGPHDRLWEACLRESTLREAPACWPARDEADRHLLLAHRQLAVAMGATGLISVPLLRGAQPCGAVVTTTETVRAESVLRLLSAAAEPLGGALHLLDQIPQGRWQTWVKRGRTWLSKTGWLVLAGLVMAAGVLAIPVPHEVVSPCILQPVIRRFVPAPFDGRLERSLVEPGDMVEDGQVLARLEGRELELEISQTLSDLHRVSKEHDGQLAEKEFGKAEVSRYEMERLQGKVELLESRASQLEIRSPLDGMILTGDLRKLEGAPLRIGQTLFEIAPLAEMTAEIQVSDAEISFVAAQQPVTMRFESYPEREWTGVIARIHPRAEMRQQSNVFIAEVEIPNETATLRPGMAGRSAIRINNRPLAWVLLHKVWDRFLMWW